MKKRIIVALGGNAIDSGQFSPTATNQMNACKKASEALFNLIQDGHELVISHGNGPQVGSMLLQHEACDSEKLPAMPLDTLVANTQGMIGFWLQNAFFNLFQSKKLSKSVITITTQVLVDQNDPAFTQPTKFIGPFYSQEEAERLVKIKGYVVKEDSNRGYRRVVPSPKPINIIEKDPIKQNVDMGNLVIAVGGGGIPVINDNNVLKGVEAVIDKDLSSAKLAEVIDADILLILTAVDAVSINFGKPNQKDLKKVSIKEMEQHIKDGQFPAGSMLPKVEAALEFVRSNPKKQAIITSLLKAKEALNGNVATIITSE